ncbi:hypothetical protein D347_00958, partial [Enterococcus faecalis LA3B-2]
FFYIFDNFFYLAFRIRSDFFCFSFNFYPLYLFLVWFIPPVDRVPLFYYFFS